jgi:hypothetical protein
MTNDMENREWLDDYLSLKQVNPNNPFTVPDGYFNELNERILSAIKLEELKNTIPADCFTVPDNYFENLSGNIQSRIAVECVLDKEGAHFAVPENYFEDLNSRIKSHVLVEEALNRSEDTFTVPQNYFEQLNKNILSKTVNQHQVKRRGTIIKMFSSTAFKYATAACIILMAGAGIFLKQAISPPTAAHNSTFLHQQLSTVPVDAIQSYLDQTVDANDTQHTVADEDLPVNDADLNNALQNIEDKNQ